MSVRLEKNGQTYMFWYDPENGRVVFATFSPEGKPVEVGYGKVGENHDIIPPLTWVKFDEKRHAGGPCALLFPTQA